MMSLVGRIGGGPAAPRRPARSGGGFSLGAQPGQAAGAATASGGVGALLALQEHGMAALVEPPAEHARRRARQALDELRGLQLDLLRGGVDSARLERLEALVETADEVSDPSLREAVDGVALRVKVELARRRRADLSAR